MTPKAPAHGPKAERLRPIQSAMAAQIGNRPTKHVVPSLSATGRDRQQCSTLLRIIRIRKGAAHRPNERNGRSAAQLLQRSAAQRSGVVCSGVQCSAAQRSAVVWCAAVCGCAVQCSAAQRSAAQRSAAQRSAVVWCAAVCRCAVVCSAAQRSAAQRCGVHGCAVQSGAAVCSAVVWCAVRWCLQGTSAQHLDQLEAAGGCLVPKAAMHCTHRLVHGVN
jgi:hypothetical protein